MKKRISAALTGFTIGVVLLAFFAFGLYARYQAQATAETEIQRQVQIAAQLAGMPVLPEGDNGFWLHTDPSGAILQSSQGVPDGISVNEDLQRLLAEGAGTTGLSADGSSYIAAAAVRPDNSRLALIRPFSLFKGDLTGQWQDMLAVSGLILLPALLAAFFLTGLLNKPLREMTRAAARIAAGELSMRIRISRLSDLSGLAVQINAIADRLENALTQSMDRQNQMEAILGSMNSGIIAVDQDGRILIFNTFARTIFGIFGEAMGKDIRDVIKNTDIEQMLKVSDNFQELTLEREMNIVVRYKTTELITDGNRPRGKVTVIQDVTDLKKLEQMRSQFVANVSHELKTPLTSIKGFAETLRVVEDPVTQNKFLDIIDAEAERLRRLIEDILSLSAIENQERTARNVIFASEETIGALRLLEMQAKDKNIQLSLIIKGEPEFLGEADMYRQMLINLIDNAIKYTDKNGLIKVRLEETRENVMLVVQDTGVGIPKEHLPRLFERFYRVDKSRDRAKGGTGLGLAIVKHIVLAFGGMISVDSKPGEGTVFTVELPAYQREDKIPSHKIQTYKFGA